MKKQYGLIVNGVKQGWCHTHPSTVPVATFKVQDAIMEQAAEKGLDKLPRIVQEYIARKSKLYS